MLIDDLRVAREAEVTVLVEGGGGGVEGLAAVPRRGWTWAPSPPRSGGGGHHNAAGFNARGDLDERDGGDPRAAPCLTASCWWTSRGAGPRTTSWPAAAACWGSVALGHAGTLDPMATGLLVLGLGRVTRLLRFVQHLPKIYLAVAVLGVATDTLDADGAVLSREPMPVSEDEVRRAAARFVGTIAQVPPDGVGPPRGGAAPVRPGPRGQGGGARGAGRRGVFASTWWTSPPPTTPRPPCEFAAARGTYVRTLADDLARALGGRAHLIALRRLSSGSLRVEQAHTLEAVEEAAGRGPGRRGAARAGRTACADLPAVRVATEHRGGGVPRRGVPGPAAGDRPGRRPGSTGCSTAGGACWRCIGWRGGRPARRWWWDEGAHGPAAAWGLAERGRGR